MIQSYTTPNGKTLYKVRVYVRSNKNPDLRITRQSSGIESEEKAKRLEASLKKECERELHETEARGILFGELAENWHEHFEKLKVATGQRSKTTHDDYLGGIRKWFHASARIPIKGIRERGPAPIHKGLADKCFNATHRKYQ